MTNLTDRYVWAAVRTAPEQQRPELEKEIHALVADATDARLESGSETAEMDAIVELGDPRLLAARYTERRLQLIGPGYYLLWLQLLKLLIAIVVPVAAVGIGIGEFVANGTPGGVIGAMITGAIQVTVNIGFWLTLVFAVIDRTMQGKPMVEWTPDLLPQLPSAAKRASLSELIASVVFLVAWLVVLVWQQFNPFLQNSEGTVPFFDPALWSFWLPWFVALTLAEIAFAVVTYRRGWSTSTAMLNVVLNLAFAIPAVWLIATGSLLSPAFIAEVTAVTHGDAADVWLWTGILSVVVIVGICIWDVIDGFLKARRSRSVTAQLG